MNFLTAILIDLIIFNVKNLLSGETNQSFGAEGATTPETLRQKDR